MPLAFFPLVVAKYVLPFLLCLKCLLSLLYSCADAAVAFGRIGTFLTAEELAEPYVVDKASKHAIDVDGDFQWESVSKAGASGGKFQHEKGGKGKKTKEEKRKSTARNAVISWPCAWRWKLKGVTAGPLRS